MLQLLCDAKWLQEPNIPWQSIVINRGKLVHPFRWLAADTYSSDDDVDDDDDDDDDDGCGDEYVQDKLSNHTQESTRWMQMVEKLISWADIYTSLSIK